MLKFEPIEDFTKLKAGDPVYFGKGGASYKFLTVFEDKAWIISGNNKAESIASCNDWFRGIKVNVTEKFANIYYGRHGLFSLHGTLETAQRLCEGGKSDGCVKITFHDDKPVKAELIK